MGRILFGHNGTNGIIEPKDGAIHFDKGMYSDSFVSAGGINPERQSRGFVTETFTTTAGVWKELNNATGSTNVCVSLYKDNALVYAEVEVTTTKIRVKTEQSQTLKAVIVSID